MPKGKKASIQRLMGLSQVDMETDERGSHRPNLGKSGDHKENDYNESTLNIYFLRSILK